MKRYGQHATLKPEKVDEYVKLHSAVWPEVLQVISDCHQKNYSIYLEGNECFCYFEYDGDDFEADIEKMNKSDIMQEWWKLTKPCFMHHDKEVYYTDWEEIFHLN